MKFITIILSILLIIAYFSPLVNPNVWWAWALFGLSYPFLYCIGIILLFYWITKRSQLWIFWMLIIIVSGCGFLFRYFNYSKKHENISTDKEIKILSQNVRIFNLYDKNSDTKFATRDSIFQYILEQQADIVCFQEFYTKDQPTSFETETLFERFFQSVDQHQRYIYKEIGRQYFGVSMFSKIPVIAKGYVSFKTENIYNPNFCIFIDVVKNLDTFRIYNVHLQSFRLSFLEDMHLDGKWMNSALDRLKTVYPQRADQAVLLTEHIENSPYPVVICGDFNDTPVSFVYQKFTHLLTDAFLESGNGFGLTYTGKIPAGRIDYIFHSPSLKSYNFKVQEKHFSDHRAISCIITK